MNSLSSIADALIHTHLQQFAQNKILAKPRFDPYFNRIALPVGGRRQGAKRNEVGGKGRSCAFISFISGVADLCKLIINFSGYSRSYTSTTVWQNEILAKRIFYNMLRTNKENFAKCRIARKCLKKRFRVIPTTSADADVEPNTDSLGFLLGRL